MKLLFDQNLSPRLVNLLADLFPGSDHVYPLGLDAVSDNEVWDYARNHSFIIVSKDADFSDMSALHGFPPRLIWLRIGNCTTGQIETLLRSHHQEILEMSDNDNIGVLLLVE